MKIFTHLLTCVLCLLIPAWSIAQSSQAARGARLPGKTLAIATPANGSDKPEPAPVPEVTTRTFTGTVVDEWDEPLAGAIITVVSEPGLTGITNANGTYTLRSTAQTSALRVTYAGYRDAQVEGSGAGQLLVKLEPIADYTRQLKKTLKSAEKAYRKP